MRTALFRRLGEREKAVAEARRGWTQFPTWLSCVALGEALREAGHLDEAIDVFTRGTQLDEKDASTWTELAELHWQRRDVAAAREACLQALARDPEQIAARRLLLTIEKTSSPAN